MAEITIYTPSKTNANLTCGGRKGKLKQFKAKYGVKMLAPDPTNADDLAFKIVGPRRYEAVEAMRSYWRYTDGRVECGAVWAHGGGMRQRQQQQQLHQPQDQQQQLHQQPQQADQDQSWQTDWAYFWQWKLLQPDQSQNLETDWAHFLNWKQQLQNRAQEQQQGAWQTRRG